MYSTKNDLPESVRTKMVDLLDARLADAIDLKTQMKQAHWNVKGHAFIALHELFDKIATDAERYSDDIAERAVQLGGKVHGTARMVAKTSALPEYMADSGSPREHIEAVSTVLESFGKSVRTAIGLSNELADLGAADLFTEISRGVDKWLWFVEAHQQA